NEKYMEGELLKKSPPNLPKNFLPYARAVASVKMKRHLCEHALIRQWQHGDIFAAKEIAL
ncbi:MAG: hypothetical protein PHE53_14035, partial [Thermoguttaceae bacterium]|nr:hypothetical protein [Thermoguttaceae bacterium]